VKITHAVPVMDLLSESLQEKVRKLFVDANVIFRSPSAGSPRSFGFDGTAYGRSTITHIKIWFNDSGIQDLSVTYVNGAVAGPYALGRTQPQSQSDTVMLAPGMILNHPY
jgi:hypothetical protein